MKDDFEKYINRENPEKLLKNSNHYDNLIDLIKKTDRSLRAVSETARNIFYDFNDQTQVKLSRNESGLIAVHLGYGQVTAVNEVDFHSPVYGSLYSLSGFDSTPDQDKLDLVLANEKLKGRESRLVKNDGLSMLVLEGHPVALGERGRELLGQHLLGVPQGYELALPSSELAAYAPDLVKNGIMILKPLEQYAVFKENKLCKAAFLEKINNDYETFPLEKSLNLEKFFNGKQDFKKI